MSLVVRAESLLTPFSEIHQPQVTIDNRTITAIASRGALDEPHHADHLDFPGAMLAPAYLDIHTHGAAGHDVMDADDASFDAIGAFLAARGVGAYLPTTVTAPTDRILRSLEAIAGQIERAEANPQACAGAHPLGIHLEGPFLSHSKRGVHPPDDLRELSTEPLDRFWQAARGRIALLTMAPELPGALEFIQAATQRGIRISLGHSNADTADALAAIAAGATSATHTFNAMRVLDHRDPGLLGVVLDDRKLYAELICDGIHVDPLLVRLFQRAKGPDHGILITDSISATGMPDGTYRLGNMNVQLANGRCTYQGSLAGSVLTMDRAVRNFAQFTQSHWSSAVRYATSNPARMMGLSHAYGELAAGRPANLVVLSQEGGILATMLDGRVIYRA